MTQEDLEILAKRPKDFLNHCKWHEQRIKFKQEQIQRFRDMACSITAPLKDVPSFGSGVPSSKVENCIVNISGLAQDIQKDIEKLRAELQTTRKAIDLISDTDLKFLLEARYLQRMKWEEIAMLLSCSYRWVLRLHGKALQEISKEASLLLESIPFWRKDN